MRIRSPSAGNLSSPERVDRIEEEAAHFGYAAAALVAGEIQPCLRVCVGKNPIILKHETPFIFIT
ncbi:MAG: hypothetical protein ACYSUI_01510, partial [Planctomycetota bacterium]